MFNISNKQLVLATVLTLGVASANAALDPAIAAAFTTLQTSFGDLLTAAYPPMIAITVGLAIYGMVRMFIRKAAGH